METKHERFKLVMRVILYPAGLFYRHPILTSLGWMGICLFAQIYKIEFLVDLINAYITISLMTLVMSIGLISRNKWILGVSVLVTLIIMFTPLLMDRLI